MKKNYYTIVEAARMTGIPASTIRHWIHSKLITVEKDRDNGYHKLTDNDIWLLFDIMRTREVNISSDYLNTEHNIDDWRKIYCEILSNITEQQRKLITQSREVNYLLNNLDEIVELEQVPFVKSNTPPPFFKLIRRDFTNPLIQKIFRTTFMSFATFVTFDDDLSMHKLLTVAVPEDYTGEEPVWELDPSDTFYVALIKRSTTTGEENTDNIIRALVDAGLKPDYMIVYSIVIDSKNNVSYFKVFIHAKP